MSFVIRVVLARTLGTDGLGIYNYGFTWIEILLLFTVFGFNRLVVRELSASLAKQDWAFIKGLHRFSIIVPFMLSLIVILAGLFAINLSQWYDLEIIPPVAVTVTSIALLLLPVQSLVRVRQGIMQAFDHIASSQMPEYLLHPVVFVCTLLLVWYYSGKQLSPELAASSFIFSAFVAFLYGEYLHRRIIPEQLHTVKASYEIKYWLITAMPMAFMNALFIINNRLDVLMLGSLADISTVGIYTTAAQLVGLVSILLATANTALSPRFARLYQEGKHGTLQELFTKSTRIIFVIAVLVSIALYIFGAPVLSIFGRDFTAGNSALRIMLAGQILNAFAGSVGVLLTMTGNSRYTAAALTISTIFNVIANIFLIPRYGADGAALATSLSSIIFNVASIIFVRKQLGIGLAIFGKFNAQEAN